MVTGTCDSSTKEGEMSRCLGPTVQPALPSWKAETSEKLCLCDKADSVRGTMAKFSLDSTRTSHKCTQTCTHMSIHT